MMRAWHFVGNTLRNGDSVPEDGVRLVWTGPLVMCKSGLHASVQPFDALQYAPGPILCMVECNGGIIHDKDKLVCSQRTIIARMASSHDATEMLRYFARMQAISVAHLWNASDVVLDYLMTGDESLRAAVVREATQQAAWAAARSAAWAARLNSAGSVAREAAREAACAAAGAAARSAAWGIPHDAEWNDARKEFNNLVYECFGVKP